MLALSIRENGDLYQQEERQRIARDLHDTLGQTLTMIKLKTELTSRLIDKNSMEAKRELNDILTMTRKALSQVREAVSELKFISLEHELAHALPLLGAIGISLDVEKKGELPLLPSVVQTMVALSIREALTNVIKHSKASQCTLKVEPSGNVLTIQIIDNGMGLKEGGNGNGIQSIKERLSVVQGTAKVTNSSSGGRRTYRLPY